MSLDELREDLKRNVADLRHITDESTRNHLANTLWPFLEAIVDVVDEMDDAVAELVDQQEDYLQPETAGIFAAVVQSSMLLAQELKKRAGTDLAIVKQISAHEQLCQQAVAVLAEITMVPQEGEEGEDEDEDDEEEDDDAPEATKGNDNE